MKEVVILVGRQGAGKTRHCQTALPTHRRISQDEGPRTFERVLRLYEELLKEGAGQIVIDRTNPGRHQRQLLIDLARRYGYRARIIYFDIPREVCEQRILQRIGHPTLNIAEMRQAIATYERRLDPPTPEECDELTIVRLPELPGP